MVRLALIVVLLVNAGCTRGVGSCDADALKRAVQTIEKERHAHPAWFGDPTNGTLSIPRVRDEVVKACPNLPVELESRLELFASIAAGRELPPRMSETNSERYRARRDKVCRDPTVFAEFSLMEPDARAPTTMARCGFDEEYQLGTRLGEAYGRLYLLAPILRQHFIDVGIAPELAKQTVELFGYPHPQGQSTAALPRVHEAAMSAPEGGLLIRATSETLALVDGPSIAFGDELKSAVLADWIHAQTPAKAPSRDVQLVMDFNATQPAAAVVAVVSAIDPQTDTIAFLLVTAGEKIQYVAAEPVIPRPPDTPATHTLTNDNGTLRIHKRGDAGEVEFTGDLKALGTWAAQSSPRRPHVIIDPTALDVQGLVDIFITLRGPECFLTLGALEYWPEECHQVSYGFEETAVAAVPTGA